MVRGWVFAVAAVGAVLLAILSVTPPGPAGTDAPAHKFSAMRAMRDISGIASAPRPSGSPENEKVRAYLAQRMRALGMKVVTTEFQAQPSSVARLNRWSGADDEALVLTNIVGVLAGKDRGLPAILVMAHHDSVWGSPGAADNAAGVAAALEVVRAVRARGQARRDLIILLTDGEELGLDGARWFFAHDPLRRHVGAVINLEARGGGGRATLFQTSHENGEAIRVFADAATRPGGSSLAAFVYSVLPNDTDLTPALSEAYTAFNFAFIGRPELYHSPLATPARLDPRSVQDLGAQALDLTTALLEARALPAPAPDVVFFDAFGRVLIVYPSWLGWIMLGIAGSGIGLLWRRQPGHLGRGMLSVLRLLFVAGLAFTLLNWLSGAGATANYYDRLAAIPLLEAMAGAAALSLILLLFPERIASGSHVAGFALPLWAMGLVAQFLAPTAAYILVVPLMMVMAALALAPWLPDWAGSLLKLIVAVPVAAYMLALGHQLMQGIGPMMPAVAALPLGLAMCALLPLWPGAPISRWRPVGLALMIVAIGVALHVRFDSVATSIPVYAVDKS